MAEKRMTFYNVDNGQAVLVSLDDDTHLMFDIKQRPVDAEATDKTSDVQESLLKTLPVDDSGRCYLSVFSLSHAHADHCQGADRVFLLPAVTQEDEDKTLIRIDELWVTACIFADDVSGPAKTIKKEAKRRLAIYADPIRSGEANQPGNMLVVFGRNESVPDLKKLPAERRLGAGTVVNMLAGETRSDFEMFVHCPFHYLADGGEEDANDTSLIGQIKISEGHTSASLLIGGDAGCGVWERVYAETKHQKNLDRLDWDVFFVPHHGTYKFFTKKEHEEGRQEAKENPATSSVAILDRGLTAGWVVCSSRPVHEKNYDDKDPPHIEAVCHYRNKASDLGHEDQFVCLMEHPSENTPEPLVLRLTPNGLQRSAKSAPKVTVGAVAAASPSRWGKR